MAELINLRLARKAKGRAAAQVQAAANRALYGQSKAVRTALLTEQDRAARQLDGARREPD